MGKDLLFIAPDFPNRSNVRVCYDDRGLTSTTTEKREDEDREQLTRSALLSTALQLVREMSDSDLRDFISQEKALKKEASDG